MRPGTTAMLVNSPFAFALMMLVFLTGFALDARLSLIAGIYTGAGYFALYLLARSQLGVVH